MNSTRRSHSPATLHSRALTALLGLLVLGAAPNPAPGQSPDWIEEPLDAPALGTFGPTPYVMVGGAAPTSFGYSPLGNFGDASMALNGPFSPMRSIAAPITVYNRGYDGVLRPEKGVSFSNPNLPVLSPVVYPTQGNYYYAPRVNRTPPWWTSGVNWIDQR